VVVACFGWLLIASDGYVEAKPQPLRVLDRDIELSGSIGFAPNAVQKAYVMAAIILLGIGERLSAVGNMMVMERDWVPTLATATSTPSLPTLNAGMRRIDLICKLVAPVFISAVALALQSIKLTTIMIAATNAASVPVEWVAAYSVWKTNARLRAHRLPAESAHDTSGSNDGTPGGLREKICWWGRGVIFFFSSDIWIPSISLALLYFSVLSFSASMITYLLAVNFPLSVITIARTCSALVEVSATAVMLFGVEIMENRHLRKQRRATNEAPSGASGLSPAAVERVGLWGLWTQLACLIPVTLALFSLRPSAPSAPTSIQAVQLFLFLALSRVGLWTYDLAAQTLVQTRVEANKRGEFSGVEMGFISACELAQWVATAIWNRPEEFKYLGAASSVMVGLAVAGYTGWIWKQRGHLIHWEKAMGCKC
jgi:iron-regulated transporter 1